MPRAVASSIENSFTGGLITEATGLNFPENACTAIDNCTIDFTGLVERRLGLDFETNFNTKTINRAGVVVTGFLWRNVAGDGTVYLYVLQVGGTLYFYNVGTSGAPISTNALSTTITLSTYSPGGAPAPDTNECQFASGDGFLFVTHPNLEPFAVSYDTVGQTVTGTQTTIMIRDFDGINEVGVSTTNRAGALTDNHLYNLLNQGWTDGSHGDVTNTNFIGTWHTAETNYPSNADIWWAYKDATDTFNPGGSYNNSSGVATTVAANVNLGNARAPNGHFILQAFNQNRNSALGGGIVDVAGFSTSFQRPSTVAFFAGRVWYAGVAYPGVSNNLYFSQIIVVDNNPTSQFGLCYQQNDPTDQTSFDLLSDDGGIVKIADCGTIYKLFAIQGALIVFASNGIWTITGSTGIGFTATDYSVNKLSSIRCISASSFVDVLGYPVWWTNEGIYTIRVDVSAGGLRIDSLTDHTIRTFYSSIPNSSKRKARGYYNPILFRIEWLYRSTDASTIDDSNVFDKVLNFNTILGSFWTWTIPIDKVQLHGVAVVDASGGQITVNTVVRGADTVVRGTDTVITYTIGHATTAFAFKYLVSYPSGGSNLFTFADEHDTTYVDWFSFDNTGESFTSSFTSGFKVHGEAQKKFETNYVYIFSQIPSYYQVQGVWNYSASSNSGKQTSTQVMSNTNTNFFKGYHRLKIRGMGLACQFTITSQSGKPFTIEGWSIWESANAQP